MRMMPDERRRGEGQPRDAGRRGRIVERHAEQRAQPDEPRERHVDQPRMPAVQVQVGEEEDHQADGKEHLDPRPPDAFVARRDGDDLRQEAEVDADIGEHRPGERRRRRQHRGALDDEEDRQEDRQQPGDAEHDAAIEREGVQRVLVRLRRPEIELRQLRRGKLGHEGDDRARVEREVEDVGVGTCLAVEREALARRDRGDPLGTEVGPEDPRSRKPEVRRHDQPVDLLVRDVGEREHRPVPGMVLGAGAHLDPPHDPVGSGRGRRLERAAGLRMDLRRRREVDGGLLRGDLDRFDRQGGARKREAEEPEREEEDSGKGGRKRRSNECGLSHQAIVLSFFCTAFAFPLFDFAPPRRSARRA